MKTFFVFCLTVTSALSLLAQDGSAGIGINLQIVDGALQVREVIPGGPAHLSQELKPGDHIKAVGQGESEMVPTKGQSLTDVAGLLKGAADSEVRLKVTSADRPALLYKLLSLKRVIYVYVLCMLITLTKLLIVFCISFLKIDEINF